jgi:hypothetical protein
MSKTKVQVQLTVEALRDFKVIQNHDNLLISHWGEKYLKGLVGLSSQRWLDLRRQWDNGVFKTGDLVPFDIRGKVEVGPAQTVIAVFITHFKLKKSQSGLWFEKIGSDEFLRKALELN